jgi:hypothetical protein
MHTHTHIKLSESQGHFLLASYQRHSHIGGGTSKHKRELKPAHTHHIHIHTCTHAHTHTHIKFTESQGHFLLASYQRHSLIGGDASKHKRELKADQILCDSPESFGAWYVTSELWEEFDAAAKIVEAWPNVRYDVCVCVFVYVCMCVCIRMCMHGM